MLVLTRKKTQTIVIGEGVNQVVIEILHLRGRQVRLGVTAPPHIKILRGELEPTDQDDVDVDASGTDSATRSSLEATL